MATATTKRPKASVVKQAAIDHTSTFLQALPEKPKEDLSLKEAIGQLQNVIREALAKGYTYQELAALLSEKGIRISAFTLKNYVPSGRRKLKDPAAKTGTRRGGRPKADKSAVAEPSVQAPESVATETDVSPSKAPQFESAEKAVETAEVAPAKSTRGRRTAAKKTGSEATVKQTTTRRRTTTAKESAPAKATSEKSAVQSTTRPTSTRRRRKAEA